MASLLQAVHEAEALKVEKAIAAAAASTALHVRAEQPDEALVCLLSELSRHLSLLPRLFSSLHATTRVLGSALRPVLNLSPVL